MNKKTYRQKRQKNNKIHKDKKEIKSHRDKKDIQTKKTYRQKRHKDKKTKRHKDTKRHRQKRHKNTNRQTDKKRRKRFTGKQKASSESRPCDPTDTINPFSGELREEEISGIRFPDFLAAIS